MWLQRIDCRRRRRSKEPQKSPRGKRNPFGVSIMSIRSKFLVHWTGGDIDSATIDDDLKRNRYLERLRDDYVNGLFARKCEEGTLRSIKLKRLIRLCFTEIRLSQVQT